MLKQIISTKEEFVNKAAQAFNVKFNNLEEKYLGKIYGMSNFLEYKLLVVEALGKFEGLPVTVLNDNMQVIRPRRVDSIVHFLISWGSTVVKDFLIF
jgi:hypothetical protein